MRVHALLSWFDEDPDWLGASVRSLFGLVDRLVAVDGAYALFPGGEAQSPAGQEAAIRQAAQDIEVPVEVYTPKTVWPSEVEKRSFMFRLAERGIAPGDWYWVIDADEVVVQHERLRESLAETNHDVATCLLLGPDTGNIARVWAEGQEDAPTVNAHRLACQRRNLFRALPGLHVFRAHHTYMTGDGRVLWGRGEERALELDCQIDHRTDTRPSVRRARAHVYYEQRDRLGIERAAA